MGNDKDLDVLFDQSGGFGWYQIILAISEQWLALHLCCTATVFYALGTIPPVMQCMDQEWNVTMEPVDPEQKMCYIRDNCTQINRTIEFESFANEFDLLCEREYKHRLLITIGAALGMAWGPIIGHITDFVGRKWVFLIGYFLALFFTWLASFSTSYTMLLWCIVGMAFSEYSVSYVYFSEMVTKKYRSVIAVCTQWCVAYCTNSLLGYLTGNWKTYLMSVAIICTPLGFVYAALLVESPRWLIQKKKFTEAKTSLMRIAKVNRVDSNGMDWIKNEKLETYDVSQDQKYPYNWLYLFSSKTIAIRTMLQCLHITVNIMGATIILFDIHELAGGTFLNIALHGLLRLWVPFFIVWLDWKAPRFGRKWWLLGSLSIVLFCYMGNAGIYIAKKNVELKILVTVFSQIAALMVVSIFVITFQLYTVELFPTVMRNIANSFIGFIGGIAAITVPQILYLRHYWRPLPFFVVTVIASITLVLDIFFLPETHGESLMESLEQVNERKDKVGISLHNLKFMDPGTPQKVNPENGTAKTAYEKE